MSDGQQLLNVSPSELKFRFELKKQIPTSLRLHNPTDKIIAFKVKTTSPKKYCVRPNTGIVNPGLTTEVTVIMQQQKETPADLHNCKDKFLVQSVEVTDGSNTTEKDFQDMFSKERKDGISESKLKVTYMTPVPPPSPVPESNDEGPEEYNISAVSSQGAQGEMQSKYSTAVASLKAADNEKKAALENSQRLEQENVALLRQLDAKGSSKKSILAGFNLVHLFFTAILAFCIGRFT